MPGGDEGPSEASRLQIDRIKPNRYQPRRVMDQEKLRELSESIKEHGVVQPILVRPVNDGYELVAGERRWRAAQLAGMREIPVVVSEFGEAESMEIALVENLQREDLNPLEEAEAFRRLMDEFSLTQEDVAHKVGRSRPAVANSLRLLSLPAELKDDVSRGTLSAGHARAILSLELDDLRLRLAKAIVAKELSVRQAEELAKKLAADKENKPKASTRHREPMMVEVEENLQRAFGTQVRVKQLRGKARGRIEIDYYSREDLERILDMVLTRGTSGTTPGVRSRVLTT